ncbi:MAG: oligosaccharide flippase family protein [Candidatus Nanoarchaeia archaeon]|nr:oligosaccharide flippase family protein [Candidatus Nanoarchaeia archaeon]
MDVIKSDQNKLIFLKGIGYLTFSKIILVILSFLFTYVCANYLGPDRYGVFNYTLGLIITIPGFMGIDSITSAMTRFLSEKRSRAVFKRLLLISLAIVFPVMFFLLFLSDLISLTIGKNITFLIQVISPVVVFVPLHDILHAVLGSFKRFKNMATYHILQKLISLGLVMILFFGFNMGIEGLIITTLISYSAIVVIMLINVKKLPFKDYSEGVGKKRAGKFITLSYINNTLKQFGSWIFMFIYGAFLSPFELGYAMLADKATIILGNIRDSVSQTLYPVISEFADDKKRVERYVSASIKMTILTAILTTVIVIIFGQMVIDILFEGFSQTYPIALLITIASIFDFRAIIILFTAKERMDLCILNRIITFMSYLIGGWLLILNFGTIGYGLTILLVSFSSALVLALIAKKQGFNIDYVIRLRDIKESYFLIRRALRKRDDEATLK